MSSSPLTLSPAALEAEETPETTSPALTTEMFQLHLRAMRLHYQSDDGQGNGPSHMYALPVYVSSPFAAASGVARAAASPNAQAALKATLKKGQADQKALVQRLHNTVLDRTHKFERDHNQAGFMADLRQQREKTKQDLNKQVDAFFDELERQGVAHPSLQTTILKIGNSIGTFVTNLFTGLRKIFETIIKVIQAAVEVARKVIKTVKDGVETVVDAIGDAWSSINPF
jgi:hypothetical protein